MRKSLRQSITGYHMPLYLQEILSNHYCPGFLEMSIVNDNSSYMFYYETGVMKRLDYDRLDTRSKLELLLTLMTVSFENEEWLVSSDNYLIEPELIYSINNSVEYGNIGILFYPDFKGLDFEHKIAIFADKLKAGMHQEDCGCIDIFKTHMLNYDRFSARRILEKNIDRLDYEQVV